MNDNYNLVQLVRMLEQRYARHPIRPDATRPGSTSPT